MMNDDKMMMTTDRSRRAKCGSPRHRRRPTSEQRNTAPSSKADKQPAITEPPIVEEIQSHSITTHIIGSHPSKFHPIPLCGMAWRCSVLHRNASHRLADAIKSHPIRSIPHLSHPIQNTIPSNLMESQRIAETIPSHPFEFHHIKFIPLPFPSHPSAAWNNN